MLDDRFYPQAAEVERNLPVRPDPALYVLRPEDDPQCEIFSEVDEAFDLQGWFGHHTGDAAAAAAFAAAGVGATFMPPFQRASGRPQKQQHHPYHRYRSPKPSVRGSRADRNHRAHSTVVRGTAEDFAELQHSHARWEQPSDGRRYSIDARTTVPRTAPEGKYLGGSLSQWQQWEIMQDRQQSSGSNCSSGGGHFIARCYNSLAEENFSNQITPGMGGGKLQSNFSERITPRMGDGELQRDLAKHRYERTAGPASTFQAQQLHQRKAAGQPGIAGMERDNTVDEVFFGCNSGRHAGLHSEGRDSRSQLRGMISPVPIQRSEGPSPLSIYPVEPTSPEAPPSSQSSSSSTARLQNIVCSRSGRTLNGTYGSRAGGRYDDALEQQQQHQHQHQQFSLAASSSMSNMPSWAARGPHHGTDGTNTWDGDHDDHEKIITNGIRGRADCQGQSVRTSSIGAGSGSSSSLSCLTERLDDGPGHLHHRQPHEPHQQHRHQQSNTAGGDTFAVLQRAPSPRCNRIHHHHQHQIDCLPAVPYRLGGDTSRRTSTRKVDPTSTSLSMVIGQDQPLDGGSRLPRGRAEVEHGCFVDSGGGGGSSAAVAIAVRYPPVAHSFSTPPPAPGSPFEWLKKMHLRQSRHGRSSQGVDNGTDTPSTASSSSVASITSSFSIGTVDGVGGSDESSESKPVPRPDGAGRRRADEPPVGSQGEVATTAAGMCGTCPAPDCPGNGDCLPGATPDMLVYEIRFKRAIRTFLPDENMDPISTSCGVLVKVEADRGEDLGIVHRSLHLSEYLHAQNEERKAKAAKIAENGGGGGGSGGGSESKKKRGKAKKAKEEGVGKNGAKRRQQNQNQSKPEDPQEKPCPVRAIKRILRRATAKERQQLQDKNQEEADVLSVCHHKVRQRSLPMKIVDAEYQFDMHKLTLFFEAERRIDFRELVRDLFAIYKTRIWMQQVKGKDATTRSGTRAAAAAASNDSRETAPPTASPDDSDCSGGAHQDLDKGPVSNPSLADGGSFFAQAFPANPGYDVGYGSGSSSGGSSCD